MRTIKLCLLAFATWLITTVVLFPAAPVVDRIRPQIGPVVLEGVSGKLYSGVIDRVLSTDDLLPLEFRNVGWTLAPQTLLSGAGATIRFEAYGGGGTGQVVRRWNGNIVASDFEFDMQVNELETLLPVPIASFAGALQGRFATVELTNNILTSMTGTLTWNNAALETPIPTSLGTVDVQIKPEGEQSHVLTLSAAGGDVAMDGSVTLTMNGDYSANVLFIPSANTPPAVNNGLRQIGRTDAQGRVRFQQQGNVNRLM